jgi:hypothetical protein
VIERLIGPLPRSVRTWYEEPSWRAFAHFLYAGKWYE